MVKTIILTSWIVSRGIHSSFDFESGYISPAQTSGSHRGGESTLLLFQLLIAALTNSISMATAVRRW